MPASLLQNNRQDRFADALNAKGVDTGVHYYPAVHGHTAWEGRDIRVGDVANAEAWAAEELSLPIHPDLTEAEIDQVIASVRSVAASDAS